MSSYTRLPGEHDTFPNSPDRVPVTVQCYVSRSDFAEGWGGDRTALADSIRARLAVDIFREDGNAYVHPDITLVMIDGDDA
jgi:hypothetical protein